MASVSQFLLMTSFATAYDFLSGVYHGGALAYMLVAFCRSPTNPAGGLFLPNGADEPGFAFMAKSLRTFIANLFEFTLYFGMAKLTV